MNKLRITCIKTYDDKFVKGNIYQYDEEEKNGLFNVECEDGSTVAFENYDFYDCFE